MKGTKTATIKSSSIGIKSDIWILFAFTIVILDNSYGQFQHCCSGENIFSIALQCHGSTLLLHYYPEEPVNIEPMLRPLQSRFEQYNAILGHQDIYCSRNAIHSLHSKQFLHPRAFPGSWSSQILNSMVHRAISAPSHINSAKSLYNVRWGRGVLSSEESESFQVLVHSVHSSSEETEALKHKAEFSRSHLLQWEQNFYLHTSQFNLYRNKL